MMNAGADGRAERRRLEKEVALDATPEQVWEAVSTGPGIATWFVPHEVDPDSGTARADFGSGNVGEGRLLAWEPGRRVAFGGPEGPEQGEVLEFLVEGREGGSTILRVIQSGFTGEDWEAEYHSSGWDLFLHNLASYFRHFAGLPVVNAVVMSFTQLDGETVWARLHRSLGIDPGVAVGDRVRLEPDGIEPVTGVVDVKRRGALGVRAEHGLYRFLGEGADAWGMVSASHYLYGIEADRAAVTAAWQTWLDRVLAEPT